MRLLNVAIRNAMITSVNPNNMNTDAFSSLRSHGKPRFWCSLTCIQQYITATTYKTQKMTFPGVQFCNQRECIICTKHEKWREFSYWCSTGRMFQPNCSSSSVQVGLTNWISPQGYCYSHGFFS
jgi:hypothetical protein